MSGNYGQRTPAAGDITRPPWNVTSSDQFNIGAVSGGQNQFGHGNVYNQGAVFGPRSDPAWPPDRAAGGAPVNALYAFADIVGYSKFNARLQAESQERLSRFLDRSVAEAHVEPATVVKQDQGDARLLQFPPDADAATVLALMPQYLYGDLRSRNQDLAVHARLRVRLSFAMGPATSGSTGLAGEAPITAVRLGNSAGFRSAMKSVPRSHCGVVVDDYLYRAYVRQDFRPDMHADEYVQVRVCDPDKGFEAQAWIRLFGCSARQVASLVGQPTAMGGTCPE